MNLSPTVRQRIYALAAAVIPLLVFYGVMTEAAAPLWLAAVGALLTNTLATVNTHPEG